MPVTKSAKKKLRQIKKRTARNRAIKTSLKNAIKKARKNPSQKIILAASKIADKAAKNHIIHKNKAARIKSLLSKLLNKKQKKLKTPKNR